MIAPRTGFIPQRGCGLGEHCHCRTAIMAELCAYCAAERQGLPTHLVAAVVLLGGIVLAAGILFLIWLARLS